MFVLYLFHTDHLIVFIAAIISLQSKIDRCRQDCADGPNLQALESSPHSITFAFLSA